MSFIPDVPLAVVLAAALLWKEATFVGAFLLLWLLRIFGKRWKDWTKTQFL